jgi:hypothetical protein
MRFPVFAAVLLWCFAAGVRAQDATAPLPAGATAELPTVVVSGEQPGPGLWKVSSNDHVLWILGTLSPLPKDMAWRAAEVEETIAQSQVVLNPPRLNVHADIGFFGKLTLLPSLVGVRDNPDHQTLKQVVPPDLYARWMELKNKYIGVGRGRNIETWRPIFAALELYDAAIRKTGLTRSDVTGDIVRDAAKRAGVPVEAPSIKLEVDNPRDAVKKFKDSEMDDLTCFRKTLDRIESDVETMAARANAWATGDVAALRKLPDIDLRSACFAAVTGTALARERGIADIDVRLREAWLDAAAAALAMNAVSFARLPMDDLLAPDGYLARLRAKGYAVESPDGSGTDDAVPP